MRALALEQVREPAQERVWAQALVAAVEEEAVPAPVEAVALVPAPEPALEPAAEEEHPPRSPQAEAVPDNPEDSTPPSPSTRRRWS